MKSTCGACGGSLEIEYYIKSKIPGLKVVQVAFSVMCPTCGRVVPMLATTAPNKDLEEKKKAEDKKRDSNYIG